MQMEVMVGEEEVPVDGEAPPPDPDFAESDLPPTDPDAGATLETAACEIEPLTEFWLEFD